MKTGTYRGRLIALSAVAFMATACVGQPDTGVHYYSTGDGLPFSESVQVGDMLYLSGQIGVAPGTAELAPGGMPGEARQTMENIRDVLNRRGLDFDAVVKCTIMLADMRDWSEFNHVYVEYFKPGRLPARSAFGTAGLAFGGKLEVECWAYNPVNTAQN